MSTLQWKRDRPGRQISSDGRFAVESDGLPVISQRDRDGSGVSAGITGGEWTFIALSADAVDPTTPYGPQVGEPVDWWPTMRDAKAAAQARADMLA